MTEMTLDIKKSYFSIDNKKYNLFDLPEFITLIKSNLEKCLPTSMDVEKEITQLSILKIESQKLILNTRIMYQELGIYLN